MRASRPIVLGVVLLCSAALWRTTVAPRWTDRVPRGWALVTQFAGTQTYADSATGALPARDTPGFYDRSISVVSDSGRPNVVQLRHSLTIRDPQSRKVTWQYITTEQVDPRTGARMEPEFRGDIALFPRNVERRPYRVRTNYLEGQVVTFERVSEVGGLETYLFSHRGPGNFGASYAGGPDYPGLKFETGQELRCADDQFYLRLWIEPLTGSTVKIEEGCPSGDFVYDRATGRALYAVDRWHGSSAGTGLLLRVEEVQAERLRYLVAERVVPLLLLIIGLVALGIGVLRIRALRVTA